MPSVTKKVPKKEKICPIKASIDKARLAKMLPDEKFKKPHPSVQKVSSTQQRQIKFNLTPIETTLKPRVEPNDELTGQVREIFQQRMFLPMISPIKEHKENFAISPPKLKQRKERLIDDKLKNFIDNFAKNIENLASGKRSYEEMNLPEVGETERSEEIFITKRYKSCQSQKVEVHPIRFKC